jgi:hypothetical protein
VPVPAPKGAVLEFYLKNKPDSATVVRIEITDASGRVKRVYSTKPSKALKESELKAKEGYNRLVWDLGFPGADITPGTVLSYGWASGPKAAPGVYQVSLQAGDQTVKQSLTVSKDPRWTATDGDLNDQLDLALKAKEGMTAIHKAIQQIRDIRVQVKGIRERASRIGKNQVINAKADTLLSKLTALENQLTQTKSKAMQDPINYPPQFDEQWNWLSIVVQSQDAKPTQGCYDLFKDLTAQSAGYLEKFKTIKDQDLRTLNEIVVKENLGGIILQN